MNNNLLYKYNISEDLNNDININLKNGTNIFICIYRVISSNNEQNIYKPFLQYLLYKYPNNSSVFKNTCSFPFIKYKQGSNIIKQIKPFVKNIFPLDSIDFNGYILNDNGLFMFCNYTRPTINIKSLNKNTEFWWGLIHEICNLQKIIKFPVHKSVYNIFYNNPFLIYLLKNNKPLEIPIVSYYGTSQEILSYASTMGIRSQGHKLFGPHYNFQDFKGSIKYGGWTSNYATAMIDNNYVSDEDGKYYQGGVIRYALFLNKHIVFLYKKNNPFYWYLNHLDSNKDIGKISDSERKKWKNNKDVVDWTKNYDSIMISDIKNKTLSGYFNINTNYIIKDFEQFIPMTVHLIDMKTLKPTWDPYYNNYNIK